MQQTLLDSWVGQIHWRRNGLPTPVFLGFPGGSAGKESACNAGDLSLIPGLGRSPGEGKGYPLQYSGLENSMDYSMVSQRVRHDLTTWASLVAQMVKNQLAIQETWVRSLGSIPGLGRFHGGGHGNPLQCSGESPWMKEPGGLQSMGLQRVRHD